MFLLLFGYIIITITPSLHSLHFQPLVSELFLLKLGFFSFLTFFREEAQRQYEEERRKKREKAEYQREKVREGIRQKYGIEKKTKDAKSNSAAIEVLEKASAYSYLLKNGAQSNQNDSLQCIKKVDVTDNGTTNLQLGAKMYLIQFIECF